MNRTGMKKWAVLALMLAFCLPASAQDRTEPLMTGLRSQGKIYVVLCVVAIIWIGFGTYLFSIDKRVSKLERKANSPKAN